MAAPNIVNVATITGKTSAIAITTASTVALTNAAASSKVFKVNSLFAANVHASSAATIKVSYSGSSITILANEISVPANSTLVVVTKEEPLYLEEGTGLLGQSDITGGIVITTSYEEIS
jgi:hypothetical protein